MCKPLLYIILLSFTLVTKGEEYFGNETIINNFGKEFLISLPPNLSTSSQSLDTISLIFTSPFDTEILVENTSLGYKNTIQLKSYIPVGLDLSSELVQTISQTAEDPHIEQIVRKSAALRIKSEDPISIFVLSKFAQTAEGFLALPIERLGTEYVLSNFTEPTDDNDENNLPAMSSIIICHDETEIFVTYGGGTDGEYVTRMPQNGYTVSKTLDKGDVWMFSNTKAGSDLSGSYIKSDKTICVISANQCANVPTKRDWCNYLVNQEIPMKYWGKSYLVPRFEGSNKSPIVRVFSSLDSSKIFINDILLNEIESEGLNYNFGYWQIDTDLLQFEPPLEPPYIISSEDEMMCVIYGRGAEGEQNQNVLNPGGPFMMTLSPNEAMQEEILFTTPNHPSRISFFENYLSISGLLENGDIPNKLEIGYWDKTYWVWSTIKNSDLIESADPVGENLFSLNLKLPYPGFFKLRLPSKLKAYVYGSKDYNSYGYAASFPLFISNGKDITPPIASWEIGCDGIIRGVVSDDNLIERTTFDGPNSFNVSKLNMIDEEYLKERRWEIKIKNPAKDARAIVRFWDEYGNSAKSIINYYAPKIKASPPIIQLGYLNIGEAAKGNFYIFNEGDKDFTISRIDFPSVPNIKIFYNGASYINQKLKLEGGDSLEFGYEFSSGESGNFDFFIRAGDDCLSKKMVHVVFSVSPPVINASDTEFPNMVTKKAYSADVYVENKSGASLEIHSFTPPVHDGLLVDGLFLAEGEKLILEADERHDYTISFYGEFPTAKFSDSLVFHSNANSIDSVCYINIEVFERGLVAQDVDFGRRHEVDGIYYTEPYVLENGLNLINEGPETVELLYIKFLSNDGNSFTFSDIPDYPKFIQSGDSIWIALEWNPKIFDKYEAEIEIITKSGVNLSKPKLKGTATRPRLKIDSLNFGNKIIGDINAPFLGFIKITNLQESEWEYFDTLRFFNIDITNIQDDLDDYGVEPNLDLLDNLELPPGNEIEIPVTWEPKIKEELPDFDFLISSDAIFSVDEFSISGVAKNTQLDSDFDSYEAEACVGNSSTFDIILHNYGDELLIVNPLSSQSGAFTIDTNFTKEFSIGAASFVKVRITFTSSGSDSKAKLIIKAKNQIKSESLELFGYNISETANVNLLPKDLKLDPDELATLSVNISDASDLETANIYEISVLLFYNKSHFVPFYDQIKLSDELNGKFKISDIDDSTFSNYLTFNILSFGADKIESDINLFNLPISALFPNLDENKSEIRVEIVAKNNTCVQFIPSSPSKLIVNEYCVSEYRNFTDSGYRTSLGSPKQNPTSLATEINYSIGISSNVEIVLYNSLGSVIEVITNKYHEAGVYSFSINPNNFSSGNYYYVMKYIDHSISRKINIVK
jgi:IgGFc binding protein